MGRGHNDTYPRVHSFCMWMLKSHLSYPPFTSQPAARARGSGARQSLSSLLKGLLVGWLVA